MTSLLHWRDVLYVGTEGGVLLALNPGDLTALWTVNASKTPVKYLVGALLDSQDVKRKSHHNIKRIPAACILFVLFFFAIHGFVIVVVVVVVIVVTLSAIACILLILFFNVSIYLVQVDSNTPSLIISFGEQYTGIFEGSENVPPSLNPPGEPVSGYDTTPRIKLLTTPSHATHMFLWSSLCPRQAGPQESAKQSKHLKHRPTLHTRRRSNAVQNIT